MSRNLSRSPLMLAAAAAALLTGLGGAVDVLPSRRHEQTPGAFGGKRKPEAPRGKLVRATGPGSINAESELRQLVLSGREKEAAEYWEACHRVYYRGHGGPKMRWGAEWYADYKRRLTA